jgi:hypothetical protein
MPRKPVTTLAFALVAASLVAAGAAIAQEKTKRPMVKEPESGIQLPVTLNVLENLEGHTLTGVAVREKTIFAVDVYACGHYVRAEDARKELADWKGKKVRELLDDDGFRKKLVTPGFARTLRLHMARDVSSEDFNEAFEESLKPRVKKLVEDGVTGAMEDIDKLKGLFTLDELVEDTKLDFTWKGNKLTVAMNVKELGSIESDALCRAMWDIYFGDDPIQDEFPQKLCARFPGVLETPKKKEAE